MAGLLLKGVYKSFQENIPVIRNWNIEIPEHEFIVFTGPSGSGKTTLLRMIAGLEDITQGELYMDGLLANGVAPKDRSLAIVSQNAALYPQMTAYENMAYVLKSRKMLPDHIRERVEKIAKLLDIDHLLDRKEDALSASQRQRVLLGRALVREPKILLLDDPFASMDEKLRAQMRAELLKVHQSLKTTFIFVTKNQEDAVKLGNRVVVIKDGAIQQADTPQNLYSDPTNVFVAGFIGAPQMNLMDAVVAEQDGKPVLKVGKSILSVPEGLDSVLLPAGREVIVGIRPDDIQIVQDGGQGNCLCCKLEEADPTELAPYLYLDADGSRITVKSPENSADIRIGKVYLSLDPSYLYLFDKATEKAII